MDKNKYGEINHAHIWHKKDGTLVQTDKPIDIIITARMPYKGEFVGE